MYLGRERKRETQRERERERERERDTERAKDMREQPHVCDSHSIHWTSDLIAHENATGHFNLKSIFHNIIIVCK